MISIHKEIRKRLKAPLADVHGKSFSDLVNTEWCSEFENLMRNRLLQGAMRYGPFSAKKDNMFFYDMIKSARDKLRMYEQTGNTEFLVDVANYMLLEFKFGMHPNRHFNASDDTKHAATL